MVMRNRRLLGGIGLLLVIVALIAILARSTTLAIVAGVLGLLLIGYSLLRREIGPPGA